MQQKQTRREFLKVSAAAALTPMVSGCFEGVKGGAEAKRKNIIVIVTDDQRWDALGCAGNSVIHTPSMDALAADGMMFENGCVTTPICMPSRVSFFTGIYQKTHNCDFNVGNLHPKYWQQSYPVQLRNAGYYTGFIGKFGFAVTEKEEVRGKYNMTWHDIKNLPVDDFDKWYGFAGQGEFFPKDGNGKHLTQIMADDAVDFLNTRDAEKPFCLSISFKAPHEPFQPDPAFDELYEDVHIPEPETMTQEHFENLHPTLQKCWGHEGYYKLRYDTPQKYQDTMKKYYRLTTGVDVALGRIVEELKRQGLYENTAIILMGDNGELEGEHLLGGKALLREEAIRVPLIVYDPDMPKCSGVRKSKEMGLNIDVAATVLDLAGLKKDKRMHGKSLVPIMQGTKKKLRDEAFFENQFRLASSPENPGWMRQYYPLSEAVRTEKWKYIQYKDPQGDFEELFDLQKDPKETKNLCDDPKHAKTKKRLGARLDAWRKMCSE